MNIHPKVVSASIGSGVGASLSVLVIYFLSLRGITLPGDVAAAVSVLIGALVSLAAGYLTPSGSSPPPS